MDKDDMKLLTELSTDMKWVKTQLSNHLEHHKAYLIMMATSLLGLIIALILALVAK